MRKKPNILVTEPEYFQGKPLQLLKQIGSVKAERLDPERLEKIIRKFDIIVVRIETRLDRRVLMKAKKLKLIASATTGLNHIDTAYAKKKGIEIVNLHGVHTLSTAEHTISLMLSLSRKIPWAYDEFKEGIWKRYEFFGTQLAGKTLGIIGLGRIGSHVAECASGFDFKIIAYDPYVKSNKIKMVPLNELLKKSDIITIHSMLTPETKDMISHKQFKMMKRTALLINTARGEIVNEHALLSALKKGEIAGAALDVFSKEPLKGRNNPIIRYARENQNLIITPHIAASTKEAIEDAGLEIAKEVRTYIN